MLSTTWHKLTAMADRFLHFLFGEHHAVDRTALWTGVIAVATFIVFWVGYIQLKSLRKISRADFAKRFIDSFFTRDTRLLFTLIMNSALEYQVVSITEGGEELDRLPYMRIKPHVIRQLHGLVFMEPAERTGYTSFEIDDLLLGQFDDLGLYVKGGLIDYDLALQSFRYYLMQTWECPVIKQYVNDPDNEGMYENVRYLYSRFEASPLAGSPPSPNWRTRFLHLVGRSTAVRRILVA